MFSNNPRKDLFEIILPDSFFIEDVTHKYDQIIKQRRYPLDDMKSVLYESIQSFNTPDFGYQLIEQQTHDGNSNVGQTNQIAPKTSAQQVTEKTFSVSFRMVDGYLNYFYLLELFFTRFQFGENAKLRGQFGNLMLKLKRPDGDMMYIVNYQKCSLIGVPSLDLAYNSPTRDFLEFSCTFGFSEFSTSLNIPELKLKETITH